jgi:hypothetical protein
MCTSRECSELFSLFSSFEGDCQSGPFVIQGNRDKLSTRKFDVGVFTQPGSKTEVAALRRDVRSAPNNGYRRAVRLTASPAPHDLDLARPAEPVRADHGCHQRRNHSQPVRLRRTGANLIDASVAVARERGRAARVNDDQMKRPLELATLDEIGDHLGEALLIVRCHRAMVADRSRSRRVTDNTVGRRPGGLGAGIQGPTS